MAKISIIMFLNWMTATMGYYGLSLISVHLTDDIYVNFVLFAVIEIPSYIFCVLVGPKICFKKSISKKLKYKKNHFNSLFRSWMVLEEKLYWYFARF